MRARDAEAKAAAEALGRGLYERMGAAQVSFYAVKAIHRTVPPWESLDAAARDMYIGEALSLYRQGFAAGSTGIRASVAALRDRLSASARNFAAEVEQDRRRLLLEGAAKTLADVVVALDAILDGAHRPVGAS